MSKNVKTLLYIGIFVACMALVLGILVLTDREPAEDENNEVVTDVSYLVEGSREQLESILIENKINTFTVGRNAKGLVIKELEGLDQNSTLLNAVGNCIASITTAQLVEENAADLAKYGLAEDDYEAKVTVTKYGNTQYVVYFGDTTPDGDTVYVRLADSKAV